MRRVMKIGGVMAGLVLVAAVIFLVPTIWFKPWNVEHFFARTFVRFALERPQLLSQIRVLEPMGLHGHSDDLNDYSTEFFRRQEDFLNHELKVLKSYDRRSMSKDNRLSTEILEWFMRNEQAGGRFLFHDYSVTQLEGIHSDLPDFMINMHAVATKRDAENYLKRVSKLGVAFDQVIAGLHDRREHGIVAPRFILAKALAASRAFENTPPRENPLYADFQEKVDALAGLDAQARQELLTRLEREIVETVQPAYARLNACLAEIEPLATDEAGVWKLPDGEAYYAQRLRNYTTTDLSADSIHALGVGEVARIQDEMRAILQEVGLPASDPVETLRKLADEPRFHYADSESERERILADYQAMIDDALERSKPLFHRMPKSVVEVRRVPEFMQATAPGGYYQPPALDNSRPGVFYANLRDPGETVRFRMRTLAYHEAIPGHHFQIAIQQELDGVPFFRKLLPFTAYTEGWGLYAERLALENGFHQDAYERLGALQAELFRAARLVVDTGIHRKRWSRDQAIDYMITSTGAGRAGIETEIDRYVVIPGQACAYKIGQLKLLELRGRARERLGEAFDLASFHDVVLGNGALPLTVLERIVDQWIEERGRAIGRDARS